MMNSKCCGNGCGCGMTMLFKLLLIVGGLNWGLVGVAMLMGSDWNVVNMLLGRWPMIEAIVYVLVGIAAIGSMFHCPCKKCKTNCVCPVGKKNDSSEASNQAGQM